MYNIIEQNGRLRNRQWGTKDFVVEITCPGREPNSSVSILETDDAGPLQALPTELAPNIYAKYV